MRVKPLSSTNVASQASNLGFDLLEKVSERSPVIEKIFLSYADRSIREYLESLNPICGDSLQSRQDLIQVVYEYTSSLMGDQFAKLAALDLQSHPFVLTANHHGVDYFAQSVQGSLLFALHGSLQKEKRRIVPIFSCGNIPLDNLTYPQGMLLYGLTRKYLDFVPAKLPIFPNRLRRTLVSISGPIDNGMILRGIKQTEKLLQQHSVPTSLGNAVKSIFNEDYDSNEISFQTSYSRQAAIINRLIWNRLFHPNTNDVPDILYLELEEVVSRLLKLDLKNLESLAYCLFFDSKLRNIVLEELDHCIACWDIDMLTKRLVCSHDTHFNLSNTNKCGTMFFWGICPKGRRIPLKLSENNFGRMSLTGIGDRGESFTIPFSPSAILNGLKEKKLLPSLFTSFIVLSFSRGVSCAGGYYQAEYLPKIQNGLVRALSKEGSYDNAAAMIGKIPTDIYLSGMQAVMTKVGLDALVPSGPLEVSAGGGLNNQNLDQILNLTVRDAHLASLMETIPDIIVNIGTNHKWKDDLAVACYQMLKNKIVIK